MRRLVALRKAFRTGTGRALHAVRESQNPDDPRSARTTWWFRRPLRRLARPRRVAHRARPQVARFRSREGPFRPPRGAADPRLRHCPPGRLKRSHGFFLLFAISCFRAARSFADFPKSTFGLSRKESSHRAYVLPLYRATRVPAVR